MSQSDEAQMPPPVPLQAAADQPERARTRDRALAEAELLLAVVTAASGEDDLTRILAAALDRLGRVIPLTGGSIALVEGDELVVCAAAGPHAGAAFGQRMAPGSARVWQVMAECQPLLSNDLIAEGLQTDYAPPVRSWLCVPLIWHGQAVGVLEVDATYPNAFDAADRALLEKVAVVLSGSIELARRYAAEQRALQEAETALRIRNDLLASVSHDLKTPIATIKGMAQLLHRQLQSGRADQTRVLEGLRSIDATATRMTGLLDELIDVARLRAGQPLELDRRSVDLVALVQGLTAAQQQATERHTIRLESAVPELVGTWDPVRLERVVTNLLSNAIKYSPNGGTISVSVAREDDQAVLAVQDRGVGIPAADLPHIFERFRRGGNVGEIAGSGVGLAGAKQIVRQHGGTIAVECAEGAGTTVTVRLPLTMTED